MFISVDNQIISQKLFKVTHIMENEEIKYLTYQDIREIALRHGIKDNKVSIGIWANLFGFVKKRKMIKGTNYLFYFKTSGSEIERRSLDNTTINKETNTQKYNHTFGNIKVNISISSV